MSKVTAQAINRIRGYWLWPIVFALLSLSLMISFFFGAGVTGSYGGGMRYRIARQVGLQVGFDIARGPEETAFYLSAGSACSR